MGSTLQGEGPAAAAPVQPPSFPTPSVYFGFGQQTPVGTEKPSGTGAGRRHLKNHRVNDETVQNKPNQNTEFRVDLAW